ncbi:DUF4150 domain-containing protein [Photobacterium halotolerans]|uniref:Uncharacterized protein n=1 Tax=Photobacterium halotolerans TaxID=265726 RepID=A0A0F5VDM1_9GAMM|nr:DUF4150 domain-containing protein [Photobacterium halotolerans]KKD00219.1 hypothetical protein KY46_08045 [Photobacterium halotolerans]
MPVTVSADGLSIVHQGSEGVANADIPDVCMTQCGPPVVPIPYSNEAKSADLVEGTTTVTMDGGNSIAIKPSKFSTSTGDEGGDKKGIVSGVIQGEAAFVTASATVKIEGEGVARLSDMMTMNKANTMCLSGVSQASVEVPPDEAATFDVTLSCRYPTGAPLANAPFTVTDEGGAELGSGTLDASGQAVVSGLEETLCIFNIQESQDPYQPYNNLPENDTENPYPDLFSYCSAVAGNRVPFWQERSGVRNDWGVLLSETFSDPDFESLVRFESQFSATYFATEHQHKVFGECFVSAMDWIQRDAETVDHYVPLIHSLAPLCHPQGHILDALFTPDEFLPPAFLLGGVRYHGTGNSIEYIRNMDWEAVAQSLSQYIDNFVGVIADYLTFIKLQAEYEHRTVIVEGIARYEDGLKTLKRLLPDITAQYFSSLSEKLVQLIENAEESIVTNTQVSGYSSTVGQVTAVVFTTANTGQESLIPFLDVYSD